MGCHPSKDVGIGVTYNDGTTTLQETPSGLRVISSGEMHYFPKGTTVSVEKMTRHSMTMFSVWLVTEKEEIAILLDTCTNMRVAQFCAALQKGLEKDPK